MTLDAQPAGAALADGAVIADDSGTGNTGVVVTAFGGSIGIAADAAGSIGSVADFPADCASQPCPNALIQIADAPTLDPMTADFEFGARILMQANETDDGENVLQKGITDEPGGQWKLQVDKAGGLPSCVVSGRAPGESSDRRVVLLSSITVADGVWHQVMCRRSATLLEIVVDGVVRGTAAMPAVTLNSSAPVTIGAKWVTPSENDQFHGMLDDVFMSVQPDASLLASTVTTGADATQPARRLGVAA
jgi:hypothetical protein